MNKLKNQLQKFIRHSSRLTYRYKLSLVKFLLNFFKNFFERKNFSLKNSLLIFLFKHYI
jgi:hypothetical protein